MSSCYLPLATPISDAKVLTGRQKPMTEIAMLFAEIRTARRPRGPGLQLLEARRRPGPVRARQGDRAGPDRRRPERHRQAVEQARAGPARRSGRSGLSTQAIGAFDVALYDLKAKRAGLSLAKLLGAYRDSVRLLQHLGRLPAHAARTSCW